MTVFEITGKEITGGENHSHNQFLISRVKDLEELARSIGKSMGMKSLDSVVVSTETDGYGFRFAATSAEKFDAKGIQIEGSLPPSALISRLG